MPSSPTQESRVTPRRVLHSERIAKGEVPFAGGKALERSRCAHDREHGRIRDVLANECVVGATEGAQYLNAHSVDVVEGTEPGHRPRSRRSAWVPTVRYG